MAREIQDHYFRQAKREGYLSRAAYKLIEMDDRRSILHKGDCVLDCGCAPGSWLQVAARRIGPGGLVVGIDLKPIRHRFDEPGAAPVHVVECDLREIDAAELLRFIAPAEAPGGAPEPDAASAPRFDVVLSDMAPNTTGERVIDHHQSIRLAEAVLERCVELLRPGGRMVMKVLEGEAYPDLLTRTGRLFASARGFRPKASRKMSTEIYVIGHGYRAEAGAEDLAQRSEHEPPKRRPSTGWGRGDPSG